MFAGLEAILAAGVELRFVGAPAWVEEAQLWKAVDFVPTLPCEGEHHSRGLSGHNPASPGAFFVVSPCCGPRVVQCGPRVAAMLFGGVLHCSTCETDHLVERYQFIPIGEVGL